jgi:hypothetical protein
MKAVLAGLLAASTALSASAATIKYEGKPEGLNLISITGQIEHGDSDRFDEIVAPLTGPTVVVLRSPGGIVVDGLDIGLSIRRNGYATAVSDDICASVCGLIWLAGSQRFLTENSKIGFHAASDEHGQEIGAGNALVGAYLSKLGLSYRAIVYLTDAPPDDMQWLSPEDAEKVGITYSLIKPPKSEPRPFITQPPPQYHAPPPASSPEQQVARLVDAYFAFWSQSGTDVESLAAYYADTVSFYGGMTSRDKIMDAKRKFAVRWPIRRYIIDPGSLFIQCDGGSCTVTGSVVWDCTSPDRGAHSAGTASFTLRVINGLIVSENGSTVTNANEQQQASTTVAYAEGRQARTEYERWYAGLPGGGYKDGAQFWAAHRSDRPIPPNCVGPPDWVAGRVAARVRLTPSDIRRSSDKNFWFGWNSF